MHPLTMTRIPPHSSALHLIRIICERLRALLCGIIFVKLLPRNPAGRISILNLE